MILGVLLILLPFCVLSSGMIHRGQQYAFIMAAVLMLGTRVKNLPVKLFVFYAAGWMLFLFYGELTDSIDPNRVALGFKMFMFLLAGMVVYLAAAKSKERLTLLYDLICIAAIVQSSLAVVQYFGIDPFEAGLAYIVPIKRGLARGIITGALGNPNFLAGYLAISLPFFFRKKWVWFVPVIVALLAISLTSTAIVAALFGVAIFYKKRVVVLIAILAGCLYVGLFDTGAETLLNGRIEFWSDAARQIPGHVIFGLGPNAPWGRAYPMHSEWVALVHGFGVVGLGLGMWYIFTLSCNRYISASLSVAAVNCAGSSALHLAPSGFLILLIMGLNEREKWLTS